MMKLNNKKTKKTNDTYKNGIIRNIKLYQNKTKGNKKMRGIQQAQSGSTFE